ncbi:MAG: HAD family hydrolase [Pseudomonadota bacterium]|nr:HAD family hydrolase [Pseudomonadota bacterium]
MRAPELMWLPEPEDGRARLAELARGGSFAQAMELVHARLDFVRSQALDQIVRRRWPTRPAEFAGTAYRLALLSSCTTAHLAAALRIAALRADIWLDVYEGDYGQFRQELEAPGSGLHAFQPDGVLFAFDAPHLCAGVSASCSPAEAAAALESLREDLTGLWRKARAALGCSVLQQTALPSAPALLGSNEHRLPGSRAAFVARFNFALREWADAEGVDLVAVDAAAARDGLDAWRDPMLWHRAKQDIHPAAAPMYGELVARILAAKAGKSRKCLVLDLDNTLWGGVIGDDGLDGIELGQGSALGEGFLAVQDYARQLGERGIILAVCSKNDEANALEPFEKHPDMALRRKDIACFVANWDDKADNIRLIAQRLNIGLDSLVFLDDNPFERNRVRQALPMVAVPEVPDEPALVPDVLAAAGYFEAVAVTREDRERGAQYKGNLQRETERERHSDLGAYLNSLQMRALWGYFDDVNRQRIVQLINKTNQFNLTTRRYDEADYDAFLRDENVVGLHVRLIDRFGDNGLIGVVIARGEGAALVVDSWLMSCRVLGRGVEAAILAILVSEARRRGVTELIGEFIPSAKNGMVAKHYDGLGFRTIEGGDVDRKLYVLRIDEYVEVEHPIVIERGDYAQAGGHSD